jgi:hypothetical protein
MSATGAHSQLHTMATKQRLKETPDFAAIVSAWAREEEEEEEATHISILIIAAAICKTGACLLLLMLH